MDGFKRVSMALATAGLLVCSVAEAAPTYAITDLGSFSPTAINDQGMVVGYYPGSWPQPVIWEAGITQGIPSLGLGWGVAVDVNNAGQVVGSSAVNSVQGRPVFHPFLYDNGSVSDLGASLGNNTGAYGMGINNLGTVVGLLESGSVYSGNAQGRTDLGIQTRGTPSIAINDRNQIAGSFNPVPGHPEISHAFRYDSSGLVDLGSSFGVLASSYATAINNQGTVVGYSSSGAFYYDAGGMHTFTSPSTPGAQANAINDLGQIVGTRIIVTNSTGIAGAFLYYPGSPPIDLNDTLANGSGWHLSEALDINNLGQIVGNGMLNGQRQAFLLTPIPEPETYAMLLAGLGLLGLARRRKQAPA